MTQFSIFFLNNILNKQKRKLFRIKAVQNADYTREAIITELIIYCYLIVREANDREAWALIMNKNCGLLLKISIGVLLFQKKRFTIYNSLIIILLQN